LVLPCFTSIAHAFSGLVSAAPSDSLGFPATCHGPQARGNNIFPRLAGQHGDYLVRQALAIQSDLRASPVMRDVIKNLSPDQMRAVATYLESLSP
jgi:cytochrome c553